MSWQPSHSFPAEACTANGFAAVDAAWQASHDPSATGECTEALRSFGVAAECGSWQLVHVATGYLACAFWKPAPVGAWQPPHSFDWLLVRSFGSAEAWAR